MNVFRRTPAGAKPGVAPINPLSQFLTQTHATLALEDRGALADYIPELLRADPRHFGIALATIDGHVYAIGDAAVPFTIQSISKAFRVRARARTCRPRPGRNRDWR